MSVEENRTRFYLIDEFLAAKTVESDRTATRNKGRLSVKMAAPFASARKLHQTNAKQKFGSNNIFP